MGSEYSYFQRGVYEFIHGGWEMDDEYQSHYHDPVIGSVRRPSNAPRHEAQCRRREMQSERHTMYAAAMDPRFAVGGVS